MAKNYSFYEVLNSNNESDPNMFNLRQRCLIPGLYYDHLSRWLKEFNRNQLFLVFSEAFKRDPFSVVDKIQKYFNYNGFDNFKYNFEVRKYFYSILESLNTYDQIDEQSLNFLEIYYKVPNKKFKYLSDELNLTEIN